MLNRIPGRPSGRFASATLVALIAFFLLSGCAGTKWVTTWVEPAIANVGAMKKILVVGMTADPANRRIFEDAMVQKLTPFGVEGTRSYEALPDPKVSEDALRAHVKERGYDGVLIGRLISKEDRTSYVPGSVTTVGYGGYGWGPYWSGYGGWYSTAYSPGYLVNETVVRIQTRLWTTAGEGKPVWTGVSESVSPSKVSTLSSQVADLVVRDLRAQKLI